MLTTKPLRIAFTNICTREWIAGCHYLKNLFMALKIQENAPDLFLINTGNMSDDYKILLPYISDVLTYPPERSLVERIPFSVQTRTNINLGADSPIARLLKKAQIDVLFVSKWMGSTSGVPLITWIPDFQHVHLPLMFTPEDRESRNEVFNRLAHEADSVILISYNALQDFKAFAPTQAHKGRVLQFVAQVDAQVYDADPSFVCTQYHLPEKFFYLPNQFWQHKNHQLVIEALSIVCQTHPDMTVVCTGNPYDYRQPRHFSDLLVKIARAGIQKNFMILGMIPHSHIFALMRQSVAVLQPSLFEGWNTSIEETKSIGKMMLLSDTPVHREQNPPDSRYFDPHNSKELASCLVETYETRSSGPDVVLEAQARAQFSQRATAFGAQFMSIVQEILPKQD